MADIANPTSDITIYDSTGANAAGVNASNELFVVDATGNTTLSGIKTQTDKLTFDSDNHLAVSLDISNGIEAGKGYVYTTNNISVSGTSEVDFMLLKNPNGSGKTIKIFHIFISFLAGTTSDYGIFRSYRNPTITTNGTAGTINNLVSTGGATAMNVYTAPTISARGTLLTTYPVEQSQMSIEFDYLLHVVANENLLMTVQPSQTNKLATITMRWLET